MRATLSPKGARVKTQAVCPLAPSGERGGGEGGVRHRILQKPVGTHGWYDTPVIYFGNTTVPVGGSLRVKALAYSSAMSAGGTDNRAELLRCALRLFVEHGYDGGCKKSSRPRV